MALMDGLFTASSRNQMPSLAPYYRIDSAPATGIPSDFQNLLINMGIIRALTQSFASGSIGTRNFQTNYEPSKFLMM